MTKKTKTVEAPVQELTEQQKAQISLTEARRDRCEPIVQKILEEMLKQDILLTDKSYIEQKVKNFFEALFQDIVYDHLNEVMQMTERSLAIALEHAQKIMWGKRDSEIKVSDVEQVFTKARKKKK